MKRDIYKYEQRPKRICIFFFQAALSEGTQQLELLRVEQARVLAANEEEILQERTRAGRYS